MKRKAKSDDKSRLELPTPAEMIPTIKEQVWQDWQNLRGDAPGGTIDERIAFLIARLTEQRNKPRGEWKLRRHVILAMALDLMCVSFPDKHGPPPNLVELMRLALDLPANHRVGEWAVWSRGRTSQGDTDHRVRAMAKLFDAQYYREHKSLMRPSDLARKIQTRFNLDAPPNRKSLRDWRKEWQEEEDK